jgi:pantothenate kinase
VTADPSVVRAACDALAPILASPASRIIVGVAGPPAAGKSTLAPALAKLLCRDGAGRDVGRAAASSDMRPDTGAVVRRDAAGSDSGPAAVALGMDGFHLANSELSRLGLSTVKGAPETFDAYGFIALLKRLRDPHEPVVYAPTYGRNVHESIGSAVPVRSSTRVVVVEGNYLLLPTSPWDQVKPLLDLACYLDVPSSARLGALLRRQRSRGLDAEAARDWVYRSDEANARLIETTKPYADVVLTRPS